MKRTVTKILSLFLSICVMLSALCITSFAEDTQTAYTDFTYTLSSTDNTIILEKYNGSATTVVIPATYVESGVTYNVVVDSVNIFSGNKKITSVTINEGVKFKDNSMKSLFKDCTVLTSVDLSETDTTGVTDMSYMFYNCSALTSLDLSNFNTSKVTTIKAIFYKVSKANITGFENWDTSLITNMDFAFNYVQGTATIDLSKWNLSNLVTNGWCFQRCYATSILLPDSLPIISEGFLNHATKFTGNTFTIPKGVKKIGYAHTFYEFGTGYFKEFIVAEGNTNYKAVDGILYSADGTELLGVPRAKSFTNGVYEIPEGVTFMGELSFSKNTKITKIILPDSYVLRQYVPVADSRYKINSHDEGNLNNGSALSIALYRYCGVAEFEVKSTNTRYTSQNGIIYSKDMTTLLAVPPLYSQYLNIPEGVAKWETFAMYPSDTLISALANGNGAYIPSTMTSIATNQLNYLNKVAASNNQYVITVDEDNTAYGVNSSGDLVTADQLEDEPAEDPTDISLTLKHPAGDDSSSYYAEAGSYIMFDKVTSDLYTVKYTHNGQLVTSRDVSSTLTVNSAVILPVVAGPNVYTAQLWNGDTMVSESESISIYGATFALTEGGAITDAINNVRFSEDTAYKAKLATGDATAIAMYEATQNTDTGVYESSKNVYSSIVSANSSTFKVSRSLSSDPYGNTDRDLTCIDLRFFLAADTLENTTSSYSSTTAKGRIIFFSSIAGNVNSNFSRLYVNSSNQLIVYSAADTATNTGITIMPGKWYNIKAYLDHEKGTTDYYIDGLLIAKDYYIGGAPLSTENRAFLPYKDSNGFYDKYNWNDYTTFAKAPELSAEVSSAKNTFSVTGTDFDEFISSGYEVRVFINNEVTDNIVDFIDGQHAVCTISVNEALTDAQVYVAPVSPDGKILNGIYGPIKSNTVSMNFTPVKDDESATYSIAANNISYSDTAVTFDLALDTDGNMKGKAYVAVYEGDELLYLQCYTATEDDIDVSVDYSAGQTIKVFWWDEYMAPLCELLEVE